MCAQLGIILGNKRRRSGDLEHITKLFGWYFTYLLLLSERRGPHATGAALLKSDGEYSLFKRPLGASEFVKDNAFRELLGQIDAGTTLLMGHTRWQTRGDASNNLNNHPIRAGEVIGTHNGTILNADRLFKRLRLPRHAEVDSELIFRIADALLDDGRLDPAAIRARLALCQGQISAVLASRLDPRTVMVIKGNKPLEFRYHKEHRAMVYASDAICLDVVFARDAGWTTVPTKPMSLMMFDCDDLMDFSSEPFRLARPNRFQRFVGCDLGEES
jgi:amidophosphoribosyltransferase